MDIDVRKKPIAIVVADSRGRVFRSKEPENKEKYTTINIIKPGATTAVLTRATTSYLGSIPSSTPVLIQFCTGINDLTRRVQHENGTELVPKSDQSLWFLLADFIYEVKRAHANTIIGIASIPMISFEAVKRHYIKIGKLKTSCFSDSDTATHQESLSQTIKEINKKIHEHNSIEQTLTGLGKIRPLDLYWHQFVEKDCRSKQKTTRRRRMVVNALTDGIHPAEHIKAKWFELTHANFLKMYTKIETLKANKLAL
jgi:hypothetical protein